MGLRLEAQIVTARGRHADFEAASVRPAADTGPQRRTGNARSIHRVQSAGAPTDSSGLRHPRRADRRRARLARVGRVRHQRHDRRQAAGSDAIHDADAAARSLQADVPHGEARASDLRARRRAQRRTARLGAEEDPGWRVSAARCAPRCSAGRRSPAAPPSPFDPNAQAPCGSMIFGPGRLLAHGVEIDMLARSIGGLPAITAFNRIVVNETRLEGQYDFDFKWTNEFAAPRRPSSGRTASGAGAGRRADARHCASGATRPEARPAARDGGRPGDRFDREAYGKLNDNWRPRHAGNSRERPWCRTQRIVWPAANQSGGLDVITCVPRSARLASDVSAGNGPETSDEES